MKKLLAATLFIFITHYNFCMENLESLELKGHSAKITHALFDPTGKYAITTDCNYTTKVWDSKTALVLNSFIGPCTVEKTGMARTGKFLYTLSEDGHIRLWPISDTSQTRQPINISGTPHSIEDISISRDGRYMLTANQDHTAQLWDLQGPCFKATLRGHTEFVYLSAFDQSASLIATASYDKTIRVWQANKQILVATIPYYHKVRTIKFDKSGTKLTIISAWSHVNTWDLKQQKFVEPSADSILLADSKLGTYLSQDEMALTHQNTSFTRICTYDGGCRLWDPGTDSFTHIEDAILGFDNPFNKHGDRFITIKKSDQTKARIFTDVTNKKYIATLALAIHNRLGAESPAQQLSQDLYAKIHRHLQAYSFI